MNLGIILFALLTAAPDEAPAKPITADERAHWAFQAPERPQVPKGEDIAWPRNPIDAFVEAKRQENKLPHTKEADRATLLRRLSCDLIGLPPTPEEIEAFLRDESPDAYEKQVDRLLASPHYGERWAQHWLDLARYADSDGFEFDQARPDAWRYRDWVVQALNADMPYDRFVRLQLAGDETDPDDSDAFIATGFNRCYPDMVDLNDQGLRRQNALNDITETTGLVFLGLTIGCARCHDHKFDPIRQADFYRLEAFFTPARFRDDYPIVTPEVRTKYERAVAEWETKVAAIQAQIIQLEAPARARLAPGLPNIFNDELVQAYQKPESERTPSEVRLVYEALAKDGRAKPKVLEAKLDAFTHAIRSVLLARLAKAEKSSPPPLPHARGLDEKGGTPSPTFFLKRGEFTAKGPEVAPAFPAVLDSEKLPSAPEAKSTEHTSGRRSALAKWLVDPKNPLTARVIVNRLWQHHFGKGIVATTSDFGTLGAEPSHPELLDWLACELIERGWSLKAMHRLMLTSASYRQSSEPLAAASAIDPENNLLWRHSRQRLDGESIRDALLAVSGELNPALGGPCVFPELPAELTKLSSKGAVWPVSKKEEDSNRRSLYVFLRRNLRFPFFEAFDRPDTNASCPRRASTTIAPQALSLLNSKLAFDAAKSLALRVKKEAGAETEGRVHRAYLLALGRAPKPAEAELARRFLAHDPEGELTAFCLALLNLNEFVYLD